MSWNQKIWQHRAWISNSQLLEWSSHYLLWEWKHSAVHRGPHPGDPTRVCSLLSPVSIWLWSPCLYLWEDNKDNHKFQNWVSQSGCLGEQPFTLKMEAVGRGSFQSSQLVLWFQFLCAYIYHFQPNESNKTRVCDYISFIWGSSMTLFNVSFFLLLFLLTLLTSDLSSWSLESCHRWPQAGDQTGKHEATVQYSCCLFGNKRHCQSNLTGSHKEQDVLGLNHGVDQGSSKCCNTNNSCKSKQSCRKNPQ